MRLRRRILPTLNLLTILPRSPLGRHLPPDLQPSDCWGGAQLLGSPPPPAGGARLPLGYRTVHNGEELRHILALSGPLFVLFLSLSRITTHRYVQLRGLQTAGQ